MMAGKAIPTLAFNQEVEASKVALDQQDKLFGTIKVSVQTLPSELDEDGNSMEMMDSNSIMAEMDSQDMIGITPFQQECQQLELDIADSVMSYTEKTLTMTSSFLTIPSSVGESRDMLSASASGRVSPVGKDFCGLLMLEGIL